MASSPPETASAQVRRDDFPTMRGEPPLARLCGLPAASPLTRRKGTRFTLGSLLTFAAERNFAHCVGQTLGLPAPCPRTAITRAKQQRRCSKWQRPPPIRLLLPGLLKPPPNSKRKLASYPRQRLSNRQTCSPLENHLRRFDWITVVVVRVEAVTMTR